MKIMAPKKAVGNMKLLEYNGIKTILRRYSIMSLVQAYITQNFILAGGDTRATLNDGVIIDNFKKIYKLNDTTIVGAAGSIAGNDILFRDYIINSEATEICKRMTYSEIEADLLARLCFDKRITEYGINSFVCGWDGSQMVGRLFSASKESGVSSKMAIPEDNGFKIISCGLNEHLSKGEQLFISRNCNNILQTKNIFKDVIQEGMKFDSSINNNLIFEKIRRSDFI